MSANNHQVGGNHYRGGRNGIQHWDLAAARGYDYFQGAITKYIDRWKEKDGIIGLEKAMHYLQKYIEIEKQKLEDKDFKEKQGQLQLTPALGKYAGHYKNPVSTNILGQSHPFGFDPKLDN